MPEWNNRRVEWFMKNKYGREFKKNSFNQMLRRLGFFPTKVHAKQVRSAMPPLL
jgi:transposase